MSGDETGFVIERRQSGSGAWVQVSHVGANATIARDDTVTAATAYDYRVIPVRPGVPLPSATAIVRTPDANLATLFFVAPTGSDKNPGTLDKPWQTLRHAALQMKAGQTLLVRGGTYASSYYTILPIEGSGTQDAWITYRNYPGETPKIVANDATWNAIQVLNAAYIIIDGFELQGNGPNVTPDEVQADIRAPKSRTSGNGISVNGSGGNGLPSHHVIVRNNNVHDFPGGGIGANQADYVTIQDNRVDSNGWYSSYGNSNISIFKPRDVDANIDDYKFIIERNLSTRSRNDVPCGCYGYKAITDGNGIILDTYTAFAYRGRTLIRENLVHDNGARGIHLFHAGNADVLFNTVVANSAASSITDGDLTAINASAVNFLGNIVSSRMDRPSNSVSSAKAIVFDYNLVQGGKSFNSVGGTHNLVGADPRFSDAARDDYSLRPGSPAIDAAQIAAALSAIDLSGRPRVSGAHADMGALEAVQ